MKYHGFQYLAQILTFIFFSLECNPSKSLVPVQRRVSALSVPLCRNTAVTTLLPAKFSEGQFQYAI